MKFIFILTFTFFSLQAEAKKLFYPVEVLASMSDLIVTGEISAIKSGTYTFKVTETIKGSNKTSVTVQKFREWECDTRQKPFEKGQKLFLFLHKSGTGYEIINGSSGELFIVNNKVENVYQTDKAPDLGNFKTAIRNFTQCYALSADYEPYGTTKFTLLKNEQEIQTLRSANEVSIWLFDKMKDYTMSK